MKSYRFDRFRAKERKFVLLINFQLVDRTFI